MVAVGRYFVFSTPSNAHVGFFHQGSRTLFSNRITERIQRAFHSPYAIGKVTGICYFLYPFDNYILISFPASKLKEGQCRPEFTQE